jgi:N-acetylglucosamine kinase-like BadF-type ATPase
MDGAGALGLAAVSAAARGADGRGPHTSLERLIPEHFGAADTIALARALHGGDISYRRLGELAPLVFEAAADDEVAGELVDRQAAEVVAYVRAAVKRLELADGEVEVVLGGGVLQSGNGRLLRGIESGLREIGPGLVTRVASSRPIVGAVFAGLDRLQALPEAYERARAEIDRATASVGDVAGDAAAVGEFP